MHLYNQPVHIHTQTQSDPPSYFSLLSNSDLSIPLSNSNSYLVIQGPSQFMVVYHLIKQLPF